MIFEKGLIFLKKEKSKHIAGKITALAAAVAMAAAFTFPIEVGNGIFEGFGNAIVASAETYTAEYNIADDSVTISKDGTYRIYGSTTTNTVLVAKDVSADITLDNVNIDVSGIKYAFAFRIENNSTGNVTIDLVGENTLKSGYEYAGLQKNGSGESIGKLTIKSTSCDGKLTAAGGMYGAGIGGGYNGTGSNIEITGGTVIATGNFYGAGIGGGVGGSGSNITITGGDVTATGGEDGAGIGGGDGGSGSYITISGGDVTATGGERGAGIGGGDGGSGDGGSGSDITISGGDVTATGGKSGAGIGGGYKGTGEKITINGGTVTAKGGKSGAGIGGGSGGTGEKITINGGTVTATGGYGGAGIGGGCYVFSKPSNLYGNASYITISGGDVTATGGDYGAGIGGGFYGSGSNITISGGTVTATGDYGGAGIGGGCEGSDEKITISGGSVYAKGGNCVNEYNTIFYGADIGGGVTSNNGSFSNGVPVTPTNGTAYVYLREIENSTGAAITINGKSYPTNHNGETKIYAYLPAKTASDPNKIIVGNTATSCYYDTATDKWIEVNNAVTYTSFNVTESNVIVYYTVTGSTAVKSQTYYFDDVTDDIIIIMKANDIQDVIAFVNYSTSGNDTITLTSAQMKAIEYVLEHDLGIAA